MNPRLLAIVLPLLLVSAGCLSTPLQSDGPGATTTENATTIDVTGTAQVSTDADLALVFVSVTARADSADRARTRVAGDVGRMRSALRDGGVLDDSVTTASFRISPRFDTGERESQIVGYDAVHAFRIEVPPDRAGEVIDLAVSNGADEVDGVQFTLTDETRASLREQALTSAVEAARADADTIATAADLSITGVKHVSTSGGFTPVFDARVEQSGGGGAATILEPGPVTVEATVSVTYTAE